MIPTPTQRQILTDQAQVWRNIQYKLTIDLKLLTIFKDKLGRDTAAEEAQITRQLIECDVAIGFFDQQLELLSVLSDNNV